MRLRDFEESSMLWEKIWSRIYMWRKNFIYEIAYDEHLLIFFSCFNFTSNSSEQHSKWFFQMIYLFARSVIFLFFVWEILSEIAIRYEKRISRFYQPILTHIIVKLFVDIPNLLSQLFSLLSTFFGLTLPMSSVSDVSFSPCEIILGFCALMSFSRARFHSTFHDW